MLKVEKYIYYIKQRFDSHLRNILPNDKSNISQAIRYAMLNGGKRLRPVLLIAVYECLGGKINKTILTLAASLEFVHGFSLIQDDLPSLDNDDYRRGVLTTHKVFGENSAILASDALLNEAYAIVAQEASLDAKLRLEILQELTRAIRRLIIGQEKDLRLAKEKKISPATLDEINKDKTGALLCACITIAGLLRNVPPLALKGLSVFGEKLGLAYQIVDDVLNVTSEKEMFKGKRFSDRQKGKATYASLVGIQKSQQIAASLMMQAKKEIAKVRNLNQQKLFQLCDFILKRTY